MPLGDEHFCQHCELALVYAMGLCEACYRYVRKHGVLRPDVLIAKQAERNFVEGGFRTVAWRTALRFKILSMLGGKCACCNEHREPFLVIDHVRDDARSGGSRIAGAALYAQILKEGAPRDKYQVLCANCNTAKQKGVCPHKTPDRTVVMIPAEIARRLGH